MKRKPRDTRLSGLRRALSPAGRVTKKHSCIRTLELAFPPFAEDG